MKLIYPFTFERWLSHPSTKPKLKQIKKDLQEFRNGKQLKLEL